LEPSSFRSSHDFWGTACGKEKTTFVVFGASDAEFAKKSSKIHHGSTAPKKLCEVTPRTLIMEATNWWFVDVSPFSKGYVQVPS